MTFQVAKPQLLNPRTNARRVLGLIYQHRLNCDAGQFSFLGHEGESTRGSPGLPNIIDPFSPFSLLPLDQAVLISPSPPPWLEECAAHSPVSVPCPLPPLPHISSIRKTNFAPPYAPDLLSRHSHPRVFFII